MEIAVLSKIVVGEDRQRQDFNKPALDELVASIKKLGLLHPIVLRERDGALHLVAGERRLRAIRQIAEESHNLYCGGRQFAPGEVPYISADYLEATLVREAELEENIIRVDLSWQERAKALSEIHNLRKVQNPDQSIRDTAKELVRATGTGSTTIRKEIARAEMVTARLDDPEVAGARSLVEAEKVVSRKIEQEFLDELERRDTAPKKSPHGLFVGDAAEIMPKIKPGSIDLIIADPPYGLDAAKFGDAARLAHRYDDTSEAAFTFSMAILHMGAKVAKPQSHIFMFCDIDLWQRLQEGNTLLRDSERFDLFRTPIIWNKGSTGHAPKGSRGFRREYEMILFGTKGKKPLSKIRGDILDVPNLRDREHAAQKPAALYEELMRLTCIPGDVVLDPCCGSGTVFRAATALHLHACGIEADPETAKLAKRTMMGDTDA